ncbi:MAG: hypothetical protein MUD06_15665 [Rhodospirillales bacterium]|nr:hypothetical protein [Rhodospirillales bacterium]
MKRAISAFAVVALLAGCSAPTSQRYDSGDVGRPIETTQGAVVSSRVVEISGDSRNVGPIAGGAAGAAATREGIEYIVRMNDGRTVTLVQNRQKAEQPLSDGTPVLVQISGRYTRVIPDPTADRAAAVAGGGGAAGGGAVAASGSGGWVDPDTMPAGGDRSAPPPGAARRAPAQ